MGRERDPETLASRKSLLQLPRKMFFLFNLLKFLSEKAFWFKKASFPGCSPLPFFFFRLLPVQENFLLKFQVK